VTLSLPTDPVVADGLRLHLRGDAGLFDSSGEGNAASIQNGTLRTAGDFADITPRASSKGWPEFHFRETPSSTAPRIIVPDRAIFAPNSAGFSVLFFITLDVLIPQGIASHRLQFNPPGRSWDFFYGVSEQPNSYRRNWYRTDFSSATGFGGQPVIGVTHHVAMVYDRIAQRFRLFMDGQIEGGALATSGENADSAEPIEFGGARGSFSMLGGLSDIRYYDRPLSHEEVDAIASQNAIQEAGANAASRVSNFRARGSQ